MLLMTFFLFLVSVDSLLGSGWGIEMLFHLYTLVLTAAIFVGLVAIGFLFYKLLILKYIKAQKKKKIKFCQVTELRNSEENSGKQVNHMSIH